jgi:hypothetical protein
MRPYNATLVCEVLGKLVVVVGGGGRAWCITYRHGHTLPPDIVFGRFTGSHVLAQRRTRTRDVCHAAHDGWWRRLADMRWWESDV